MSVRGGSLSRLGISDCRLREKPSDVWQCPKEVGSSVDRKPALRRHVHTERDEPIGCCCSRDYNDDVDMHGTV